MTSLRASLLLPASALAVALLVTTSSARAQAPAKAPADAADPAKGDPRVAEALKSRGFTAVKSLYVDFDGDGTREYVVAVTADTTGVQLVVVGEPLLKPGEKRSDEKNPKLAIRTVLPPAGGKQVKSLEAKDLVPPKEAMEIVLEIYDETPDEKVKRIRVYDGHPKPREIFTNVIFRPKNADDRDEFERDKDVVSYGDAHPGWYMLDLENDGLVEILVRRKPQILTVHKSGGDPAKLLTGVREAVYAFEGGPEVGVFKERNTERFNDFLPAYPIEAVSASSTYVDKNVLKDLQAKALSEQLDKAADPKNKGEVAEPKVDLMPFTKAVADRDLSTSWIENAKDDGAGEWVELKLPQDEPIHMVRVVGGCAASKGDMKNHNVPTRFKIRLGTRGREIAVDRYKPGEPDSPALAVLELPVKDRPWAQQTLVFFDGKDSEQVIRVTLDKAGRQGSGNLTCLSEVSVH